MSNFQRNDMRKSMTTMMMLMTSMFGCAACSSDGAQPQEEHIHWAGCWPVEDEAYKLSTVKR